MSERGRPEAVRGVAFNQVPDSENEIHGDEVARRHGFAGGLVPGVTVSAYLCDPAVRAWGMDFLTRGEASVVVKKPLYDGDGFEVRIDAGVAGNDAAGVAGNDAARVAGHDAGDSGVAGGDAYKATLINDAGVVCAEGRVGLAPASAKPPELPVRRGDPRKQRDAPRPPATREGLETLARSSMCSIPANWGPESEMASYYRRQLDMPELLRHEGGAGYANMAFILGLTNWHLAANVKLGPWLHLQTDSRCFAPIESGAKLVVEGQVVDLFERKGHHFVDVDVAAYRREGDAREREGDALELAHSPAVMRARLRAIYRLRGA